MPSKRVKYNKHKHTQKSQCITGGIIRSITFRDKMYANMKHTPTNTEAHANIKTNFKNDNKIIRQHRPSKDNILSAEANKIHKRY